MKTRLIRLKFSLALISLTLLSGCNGGGGGDSSQPSGTDVIATSDSRPIANAGPDQVVTAGQLVTLNGKQSFDPEGLNLIFQWRQISGTAITLSSESDDTPSFIAPAGNQTLTFQLVTDDGKNLSVGDTVTVTVTVANANNENTNNGNTDNTDGNNGSNDNSNTDDNNSNNGNNSEDGSGENNTNDDTANDEQSGNTDTSNDEQSGNTDSSNEEGEDNASDTSNDETDTGSDQTDTTEENTAPIANAGQDRVVNGFSLVILDGLTSSDPENDSLTFEWIQTSGTLITLNNSTLASPSFDAPNINDTLVFSLIVSDAEFLSEADHVSITIEQVNTAPTANAGQDITAPGLSQVTLQGSSSSDPEADNLSFEWQQTSGPVVILNNNQLPNPSFEAPNIDADITFSLVVNDGEFSSSPDNVSVTIQAINTPPLANAGDDRIVQGLSEVTLDGSLSSDPENSELTYTWTQISGPSITLTDSESASPSFIAPNIDDMITFSLTVHDGQLSSELDTVSITIEKINTAPVAHAGVDRYVGSLSVVALNGTLSTDADGDPITFTWSQLSGPSVTLSDLHSEKPIFTADTDGQLIFSLTVNDGQNDSEIDTVQVMVGPIPATNIKVNGTGITWGGSYPTGNNSGCIGEAIEQQDCSLGRELTHNDDSDGRVGFSFTKFDSNGVDVGNNASEWQCVQDSVTGLMWEIKSGGNGIIGDEGINDADDRYSWYNSDPASNGGGSGFMNNQGEVCSDYDAENPQSHCNTQAFVARMNSAAWCGFADWRLPTRKELLSIVDYGNVKPMIDSDYFPEVGQFIWTSTPLALGSVSAWGVNFNYGNSFSIDKRNARQVRLVRGGYE